MTAKRMTVDGKGNGEFPKNGRKTEDRGTSFKRVVSEGSTVVLDAGDLVKDIDTNSIKYCSWEQTAGIPIDNNNDSVKDESSFSFTAPYVDGNAVNTHLTFELTIREKDGKTRDPYKVNVIVKRVQRAIIFQAGVALGAYEAGVFQALVKRLSEEHDKRGLKDKRPLFDIVAGASIGAFNAAIVVNSAIESKNWEDAAQELIRFWKYQEYPSATIADLLDMNPLYHMWWDTMHVTNKASKSSARTILEFILNTNPHFRNWYDVLMNTSSLDPDFWKDYFIDGWYIPAAAETARRYYSSYQCKHFGTPHVASGIPPWFAFGKFFDFSDLSNFIPRPDNKHFLGYSLKNTLENFAHFPIKTAKPDPRFLLVTVDVQTGDSVTLDSYEKTEQLDNLGQITNYHSEYGDEQNKHVVSYERGIEIEHVLASGTFPDFFDYPKLKVKEPETKREKSQGQHNFWDGSLRSTTPLREVIQAHRDYWHEPRTDKDDVPDLEVYIADLWPSKLKEEPYSFDHDFVENRKWNILFSDKTDYDEQVAKVVTDYNDLVNELRNMIPNDKLDGILEKYASSENRNGKRRTYKDIIGGRFRLTKVVRVDRKDDGNEVHGKIFDYSRTTIENLMRDGYCDALTKIGIQSLRERLMAIKSKTGNLKDSKNLQELEQQLQQLEMDIRVGNSNDSRIQNQIENFARKAESMPNEVNHKGSIKEEKAHLINAAKQFKEIIIETKNLNELPWNP